MSDGSRVPHTIPGFAIYVINTDNRLQAVNLDTTHPYYVDYGLSVDDADAWHEMRQNWEDTIYPTYTNPITSTSVAKADVQSFMSDFRTLVNPLLDIIEVSPIAGNDEEHIFNFVLHRANPSHRSTPFHEECIAGVVSEGRGMYEISCKSTSDSHRASKVPGADSVQFSFVISAQPLTTVPAPEDPSMIKELSTRALFHKDFGAENQGSWLYICFRWYNTKNPAIAGPWSAMQVLMIA